MPSRFLTLCTSLIRPKPLKHVSCVSETCENKHEVAPSASPIEYCEHYIWLNLDEPGLKRSFTLKRGAFRVQAVQDKSNQRAFCGFR